MRLCQRGVLQFVIVKPIVATMDAIMLAAGLYFNPIYQYFEAIIYNIRLVANFLYICLEFDLPVCTFQLRLCALLFVHFLHGDEAINRKFPTNFEVCLC
jgi:hypothetical protein